MTMGEARASAPNSHWEIPSLANDLDSSVLRLFPARLGTSAPPRDPCFLSRVTSQSSVQEPTVASTSVHSLGGSESEELEDTGPTKTGNRGNKPDENQQSTSSAGTHPVRKHGLSLQGLSSCRKQFPVTLTSYPTQSTQRSEDLRFRFMLVQPCCFWTQGVTGPAC